MSWLSLLPILAACCSCVGVYLVLSSGRIGVVARVRATMRRVESRKVAHRHVGIRPNRKRMQADVLRDMPLFLDIVTLGVSAGLSFDSSLDLYCDRYDTVLSNLVSQAMLSWRMGTRGRAEALDDLAQRTGAPAMQRFASTVSEALAFGTPLAGTLARQAQVIRDEQRGQLEEEIERVPVKMLIPLGTLIVPAMLLAILGPLLGPALQMG